MGKFLVWHRTGLLCDTTHLETYPFLKWIKLAWRANRWENCIHLNGH
jgi:hypothetical protein